MIGTAEEDDSSNVESSCNADKDYVEPMPKKRKTFPWSTKTLNLLGRSMVNNNAAASLLTASVLELGFDSDQMASSSSTIRRHRGILLI